jgi:hypothetical protein
MPSDFDAEEMLASVWDHKLYESVYYYNAFGYHTNTVKIQY